MKLLSTTLIVALLIVAPVRAGDAKPDAESKNPVKLETIIALATGPEGETPAQAQTRAVKFDAEIDRLLDVLPRATGKKLKPPVRMSGLSVAKTTETVDSSYVQVTGGRALKSARNSVVVLEPGGSIESVGNSIVILPSCGSLTKVHNSIVLARYKIDIREAQDSVILSGYDAIVMLSANNCVCGARELLWIWYPLQMHDLMLVNSKLKYPKSLPKNSRVVKAGRLDLMPVGDHSLDGNVTITAGVARGVLALLRTKDGKGEYVARRGEPVLDPDGKPVAAINGWRLETVLNSHAVFVNHGRRAVLPVVPVKVTEALPRARPLSVPAGDTKTGPVRVETLIRLSTGPDHETPQQARARAAQFDHEIDRLLALLSHGNRLDLKPPVRMSDLPVVKPAKTVDGGYVNVTGGEQVSARNSIIVIVPFEAGVGSVRNSIVLARYDVNVSASDSVVLSCFDLFLDGSKCVCGAGRNVLSELGIHNTLFVNTKIDKWSEQNNSRALQVKGLVLTPAFDNSLNNVVKVTFSVRYPQTFALLRTKDGKGEYVARGGQPVLDPDGRPVAALAGWQLDFVSGYAVFEKDGRYAMMEVE